MTTNQIAYFSAKENQRHNIAMEQETKRHNLGDESIRTQSNLITESHYSRMDSETLRHNLATEEQARAQLNLGYAQLDLGNRQLVETTRHNMASESLQLQTLTESKRHNVQSEKLGYITANETIRHNIASENLQEELNGSSIVANYAKANESNASASLKQAQVTTETYRQSNYLADTGKKEAEKAKLEKETKYLGSEKVSNIVKNYSSSFQDVTGGIKNVVSLLKGGILASKE